MPESTVTDENGWVRVTDKDTGHKRSVREGELPHGNYTVLKAEASDPITGEPLPPEHDAVKPLSSPNPSGQQAETKKESTDG